MRSFYQLRGTREAEPPPVVWCLPPVGTRASRPCSSRCKVSILSLQSIDTFTQKYRYFRTKVSILYISSIDTLYLEYPSLPTETPPYLQIIPPLCRFYSLWQSLQYRHPKIPLPPKKNCTLQTANLIVRLPTRLCRGLAFFLSRQCSSTCIPRPDAPHRVPALRLLQGRMQAPWR